MSSTEIIHRYGSIIYRKSDNHLPEHFDFASMDIRNELPEGIQILQDYQRNNSGQLTGVFLYGNSLNDFQGYRGEGITLVALSNGSVISQTLYWLLSMTYPLMKEQITSDHIKSVGNYQKVPLSVLIRRACIKHGIDTVPILNSFNREGSERASLLYDKLRSFDPYESMKIIHAALL